MYIFNSFVENSDSNLLHSPSTGRNITASVVKSWCFSTEPLLWTERAGRDSRFTWLFKVHSVKRRRTVSGHDAVPVICGLDCEHITAQLLNSPPVISVSAWSGTNLTFVKLFTCQNPSDLMLLLFNTSIYTLSNVPLALIGWIPRPVSTLVWLVAWSQQYCGAATDSGSLTCFHTELRPWKETYPVTMKLVCVEVAADISKRSQSINSPFDTQFLLHCCSEHSLYAVFTLNQISRRIAAPLCDLTELCSILVSEVWHVAQQRQQLFDRQHFLRHQCGFSLHMWLFPPPGQSFLLNYRVSQTEVDIFITADQDRYNSRRSKQIKGTEGEVLLLMNSGVRSRCECGIKLPGRTKRGRHQGGMQESGWDAGSCSAMTSSEECNQKKKCTRLGRLIRLVFLFQNPNMEGNCYWAKNPETLQWWKEDGWS